MKFKRLLTAGLMALFCAGTATAASQLNSVHVTPKDTTATVRLQTTGTFAHKEYRPDGHLLLIDLSGVTADPSLVRTVAFRSAVLKSYTLSSYTSAAGIEVTRVEITLGENVTADVVDASDGLQVLLSGGGPSVGSAPSSNPAGASRPRRRFLRLPRRRRKAPVRPIRFCKASRRQRKRLGLSRLP